MSSACSPTGTTTSSAATCAGKSASTARIAKQRTFRRTARMTARFARETRIDGIFVPDPMARTRVSMSLGTKLAVATVGVLAVVSLLLFVQLTQRERESLIHGKET